MLTNLKKIAIYTISSLFIIFSAAVLAENWHYSIIVDAGSTGSRLHLFRYNADTSLPIIEDMPLYPNKTSTALTSFTKDPDTVKSSLDTLFNTAITTLNNEGVAPQIVSVSILGTAGMRLLRPDEQQAIYNTLSEHLKKPPYLFTSVTAKTITGEEEGIYDWLDVNYLAKNFNNSQLTLGCIDMGGASMEIVFATQETQPANNDNVTTLIVNGQKYTLYSKSILGLGQDVARKNIADTEASASCYPSGYPFSPSINGSFNFDACKDLYGTKILIKYLTENDLFAIPRQQKFIALGSIFYSFKFFAPDSTTEQATQAPQKATLENNIKNICTMRWQDLKQHHSTDNYLANDCANGVYIDELLFGTNGYQLQDSQLFQISNTINQQPIDWSLGAILSQLVTSETNSSSTMVAS